MQKQEDSVSEKDIAEWLKLFYNKNENQNGDVFVNKKAKVIFPPLTSWEKNFIKSELTQWLEDCVRVSSPMELIKKCSLPQEAVSNYATLRVEDVLDFVKMAKDIVQLKNTKDHETSVDISVGANKHQLDSDSSSAELQKRVYKDLFGEA